jgi:hypothetical protein
VIAQVILRPEDCAVHPAAETGIRNAAVLRSC